MEELEFKKVVSENLVKFRRESGLTQLDIAKKLNYSDKAVSKWERGEAVPDAFVLKQLSAIYNISVDELLCKKEDKKRIPFSLKRAFKNKHFIINCLACGLAWLVACIVFVVLSYTSIRDSAYLAFIYALPVGAIANLVLTTIWSPKWVSGIFATIVLWTGFLAVYLTVRIDKFWLIFIIAIPIQVLIVLWYFLIKETKKIKKHMKQIDKKEIENQIKNEDEDIEN